MPNIILIIGSDFSQEMPSGMMDRFSNVKMIVNKGKNSMSMEMVSQLARGILSQSQYQWLVRAILHQAQGVFLVFVFLTKPRVSWCPIIYKVFSFR